MTAPDHRGNVEFLLQRGRRPYMACSQKLARAPGRVRTWGLTGRWVAVSAGPPLRPSMTQSKNTSSLTSATLPAKSRYKAAALTARAPGPALLPRARRLDNEFAMRRDQHLAKLISLPRDWQMQC